MAQRWCRPSEDHLAEEAGASGHAGSSNPNRRLSHITRQSQRQTRPPPCCDAQSDLIGLALQRRYGGVWIDATMFMTQPLDWLPRALDAAGHRTETVG
jgi:hypothetical protein